MKVSPLRLSRSLVDWLVVIQFAVFNLACTRTSSSIETAKTLRSLRHRIEVMQQSLDSLDQLRLAREESTKQLATATTRKEVVDCATIPGVKILEIRNIREQTNSSRLSLKTTVRVHSDVGRSVTYTIDYLDANENIVCQYEGLASFSAGESECRGWCDLWTVQLPPEVARTEVRFEERNW